MKQIEIAKRYLGEKELTNNTFSDNTELGRKLHEAGQKNGEAWCSYFSEAVFCEAFPYKNPELRKIFSASAVHTFKNLKDAGYDVHDIPQAGDLVIWQRFENGVPQWTGHAGIVVRVNSDGSFFTIEGNTNEDGEREGTTVAEKLRKNIKRDNGLNILGFIRIT